MREAMFIAHGVALRVAMRDTAYVEIQAVVVELEKIAKGNQRKDRSE